MFNAWRFYFFNVDDINYCFDSFTHKILSLDEDLLMLLKKQDFKAIKKHYNKFYRTIIKKKPLKIKKIKYDKCNITINLSNRCNLNCSYCYRNKTLKDSLSNQDLEKIISYAKEKYDPKAPGYSFSLCYTSESSLDLEKLKYFDYLIGQNEGYLFDKKQISQRKAKSIFLLLPKEIQEECFLGSDYIINLNKVLTDKSLWKVYDYSNDEYIVSALAKTSVLSYSKRIKANRHIINQLFESFDIEKRIQYLAMSFMTNGTNVTDDFISFMKSILLDTIYVSIDGPALIHNKNRVYISGDGTYDDVVNGIQKLLDNGINVVASVVITPDYPEFDEIINFLTSFNFSKISFNLSRGNGKNVQFTKNSIDKLIASIKRLLDKIYFDFCNGFNDKEFLLLKDTLIFRTLKLIYRRTFISRRCNWGYELVVDAKGYLYHCNSTIGYTQDCLGHYSENKSRKKLLNYSDLPVSIECKTCYAHFLCGGTCYAEKIMGNKNNQEMECYFHKELINTSLKFYVKLHKNLLLDRFIENLE